MISSIPSERPSFLSSYRFPTSLCRNYPVQVSLLFHNPSTNVWDVLKPQDSPHLLLPLRHSRLAYSFRLHLHPRQYYHREPLPSCCVKISLKTSMMSSDECCLNCMQRSRLWLEGGRMWEVKVRHLKTIVYQFVPKMYTILKVRHLLRLKTEH